MIGDRRERIEQLFAAALERPPAQRAAYLSEAVEDEAVHAEVLSLLQAHEREAARAAERLGQQKRAAAAYQYVVDVWRHADPELELYVREARAGLERLATEPRH